MGGGKTRVCVIKLRLCVHLTVHHKACLQLKNRAISSFRPHTGSAPCSRWIHQTESSLSGEASTTLQHEEFPPAHNETPHESASPAVLYQCPGKEPITDTLKIKRLGWFGLK